jgi:hypothetical protein
MFVLSTVTDGTETISCKRALPMPLDAVNVKFQEPLVGVVPCFAPAIYCRRSSGSGSFGTLPRRRFLVRSHNLKFILESDVRHYQIKGGSLKKFIAQPKLVKDGFIARMQQTKKEHGHDHSRNENLTRGHLVDHSIEPQLESHDLFRLAHTVVEERHKSHEGVGNQVRMAGCTTAQGAKVSPRARRARPQVMIAGGTLLIGQMMAKG